MLDGHVENEFWIGLVSSPAIFHYRIYTMFRIESYITSIILSYVEKYVKNLRRQDAQVYNITYNKLLILIITF